MLRLRFKNGIISTPFQFLLRESGKEQLLAKKKKKKIPSAHMHKMFWCLYQVSWNTSWKWTIFSKLSSKFFYVLKLKCSQTKKQPIHNFRNSIFWKYKCENSKWTSSSFLNISENQHDSDMNEATAYEIRNPSSQSWIYIFAYFYGILEGFLRDDQISLRKQDWQPLCTVHTRQDVFF